MPRRNDRDGGRNRPGADAPADPSSPAFRIADYTFYRMARAGRLYARRLERALKPRGMDQPHWRVLMILQEHEPASMGLIAEMAVMKLPTVVKLIQRMVEEGYVRAAPRLSDQRVMEVGITPLGRRELVHVRRAAAEVYHAAIEGLAPAEVARLNELLQHLEHNLLGSSAATGAVAPAGELAPAPARARAPRSRRRA